VLVALAAISMLDGRAAEPSQDPKPRKTGLVEKASAHLAQLDVTVTGPRDAASSLTPDDFLVLVAQREIRNFQLDALCAARPAEGQAAASVTRPASYLFYFDQRHLTPSGRRRSLQVVREMVPRLIVNGSRGMVVSSARKLRVFAQLTTKPEEILAALAHVENDPEQTDASAIEEEMRVAELESLIAEQRDWGKADAGAARRASGRSMGSATGGSSGAGPIVVGQSGGQSTINQGRASDRSASEDARQSRRTAGALQGAARGVAGLRAHEFERDEALDSISDFGRLTAAIGRLAGTDPPKILLYFADTARRNAGAHYMRMLSGSFSPYARLDDSDTSGVISMFDAVLREAASQGVRFYSVQAEGLAMSSPRAQDAQATLVALAVETGGKPFLNGVSADRMADGILDDLSCLYLVSFAPEGFPKDRPLPVQVTIRRPGLSAQVRGQLVLQSEPARRSARLLAAFSAPEESEKGPISAAVIPIGHDANGFSALVQVAVPAPAVPGGSWEIGATLVRGGSAREIAKRTITTNVSGIPVVLEREERFAAGKQEIVAVARETSTETIVSRRIEFAWPDIKNGPAIGPIAVLEPVAGAFVRGEETYARGLLARSESEPLRADHLAAIVTLVCRGRDGPNTLRVERRLVGEATTPLPPLDLDLRDEPCAQVRDLIPAGTFGAGRFVYELRAIAGGIEVARGDRRFVVVQAPQRTDEP
jgi:hypothetical protein